MRDEYKREELGAGVRGKHDEAPPLEVRVERDRVWIVRGVQSFMLAYDAETDEERQWYAQQLRGALAGGVAACPLPSSLISAAGIVFGDMPHTVVEKLDAAARAAGVPAAAPVQRYRCVKCGYSGPEQINHQRPNGTGECGYIAARVTDGVKVCPGCKEEEPYCGCVTSGVPEALPPGWSVLQPTEEEIAAVIREAAAGVEAARTELWDAITELVVACGGSAADFDEAIADRIDAAARGVPAAYLTERQRVAIQFYTDNPRAAEFDFGKRFDTPGVSASGHQTQIDWGAVDAELLEILSIEDVEPGSATGRGIIPPLRALLRKVSGQ